MPSKVARLTDSADTAAVTLLSQIHSRTAEPSELLPTADNTDFCSAAHHIYGRFQRPISISIRCTPHRTFILKIKTVEQQSATFLRDRCFVAVATRSTQVSSLGLSARFIYHTPLKSFGLALVLITQ